MNKDFISFCIKAILFLMLIVIVDQAVGITFVSIKDKGLETNPENMWLKTAFVVEKVDTDVIIVGSSKASHHYIPELLSDSLGMSVYNCGQDGCFFLYQNCIINMVLDRYAPKMIIWDIQPECFDALSLSKEYQNIRYLSPYYEDNDWVTSYIESESSSIGLKMLSKMFAYNSKVLNYIHPLLLSGSQTNKGYIPLPSEGYNYPILKQVKDNHFDYQPNEWKLSLLDKTIDRCKEKGVELKIYVSPEYRIKQKSFMLAAKNLQHNIGESFADYSSDSVFMASPEYFKDSHHLNDKGAQIYTKLLISNILE